jgi:hypothetical protein
MEVRQRKAVHLGPSTLPCGICGGTDVVAVETRLVRHGIDWLNPRWRSMPRTHDLCRGCGAKHRTEAGRRI